MRRTALAVLMLALACASPAAPDDSEQAAHRSHRPVQPAGFDHRESAGLSCSVCHDCAEPTPEEPCLQSCPRHGGHFYGQHAADEGPDVVIMDHLADIYRPVVFAHRLHAGMAAMSGGCTNCHHYSETSGVIPACRECHVAGNTGADLRMPSLKGAYHRQCTNCHLDWSDRNGCGFCHQPAGDGRTVPTNASGIIEVPHPLIKATETYIYQTSHDEGPVVSFHHADHVDLFGQQCVDCHRGNACASCHGTGPKTEYRTMDHVTECGACHVDRDCGFCHAAEAKPRFDHALSTGWDLEPHHGDGDCRTCHGDPDHFRTPTGVCTDCHIHWDDGSFDHRVTGLRLDAYHEDADCGECHLELAFEDPPTCLNCHDEPMYPDRLPGESMARR